MNEKRYYFASDFHLGLQTEVSSRDRERKIVEWLEFIYPSTQALYLLGDIFDFWWEYRRVVPKGFVRFLATLAHFSDTGVPVHVFTGNHDIWMRKYLEEELGVRVYHTNSVVNFYDVPFFLAHGDGLGTPPLAYRLMRSAFHSHVLQNLFSWLVHPDIALWMGYSWSHHNRYAKELRQEFRGMAEPVAQFAQAHYDQTGIAFYLLGHLHIAALQPLVPKGALVLLGDWITQDTYASLDGEALTLWQYCDGNPKVLYQLAISTPVASTEQ